MRKCVALGLAISLLAGSGCGSSEGFVDVVGTVKFADGTVPAGETAMVLFQPISSDARAAYGEIQSDGSFELSSQPAGDGALPGDYKVVLQVAADYRSGKSPVPERYAKATSTPLEATVSAEQREFNFVVEKQ